MLQDQIEQATAKLTLLKSQVFNLTTEFSNKQNQSFQLADEEKQVDDKRRELRQ